jgi:hypothetical protein
MTPLFTKLNLRDQQEIFVLDAPESFGRELALLRGGRVDRKVGKGAQVRFAIAFATTQAELTTYGWRSARTRGFRHSALGAPAPCPPGTNPRFRTNHPHGALCAPPLMSNVRRQDAGFGIGFGGNR